MVDDALKIFAEGGYALLLIAALAAANLAQWRDRQKLANDFLALSRESHDAQIEAIKILIDVKTRVEKCPR